MGFERRSMCVDLSREEELLMWLLLLYLEFFIYFCYTSYTTRLMLLDSSLGLCQTFNFNKCFVGLVKMKIHLGKQCTFSLCNYLVMSM